MKIKGSLKYMGLAALVLTVAAGCASVQEPASDRSGDTRAAQQEDRARQAIQSAKQAIETTAQEAQLWRDTEKTLAGAEKALEEGNFSKAVELAQVAQGEAEMALEQRRNERENYRSAVANGGSSDQGQGGEQVSDYRVQRGDSLWAISGKASVYDNPYQWPLIFRANRDEISDADMIHPDQELRIERRFSDQDAEAAMEHARTRGAWELGTVEASDTSYLRGRNN